MNKKVVLLTIYNKSMNPLFEEIGLCQIASYLRENGYSVMLLGKTEEKVDYEAIKKFNPGFIGLSMFASSKNTVYRAVERFKADLPDCKIFTGGFYPSTYDEEILTNNNNIDFIVRNDGEVTTLNLLNCLNECNDLSTVLGVSYFGENGFVHNPDAPVIEDLDSMPFACSDVLAENKLQHALISTSRACVHNCSFCISKSFWRKWRGRSADSIVAELKEVVSKYDVHIFDFVDSSFEDPDKACLRLRSIVQGIVDSGINISYWANMRANFVNQATPELVDLMVKSGLAGVFLGIETNDNADRALYQKSASKEDNYAAIKMFRENKIGVSIGFINFNPYSTLESLRSNIDFLEEYNFARLFKVLHHKFIIYNNRTDLYWKLKKDNLLVGPNSNFELQYRFVDEKIAKLSKFLDTYFAASRKNPENYLGTIDYYNNTHYNIMYHYLRLLSKEEDPVAYEAVGRHIDNIESIFLNLSHVNAKWLRKLLDLISSWDDEKAANIVDEYLNIHYLEGIVNKLNGEKLTLYKTFMSIDSKYEKFII